MRNEMLLRPTLVLVSSFRHIIIALTTTVHLGSFKVLSHYTQIWVNKSNIGNAETRNTSIPIIEERYIQPRKHRIYLVQAFDSLD